jgi:hypothetical protein
VNAAIARSIAHSRHHDQRDRRGALLIEHVDRVAARVGADERAIAYLHDLLEWTDVSYEALRADGLTDHEAAALELLTRTPGESYELYVLRITHAEGRAGRLARAVKRADLEDHMRISSNNSLPGDPPYGWARRHIAIAQERRDERAVPAVAYRAPECRQRPAGHERLPPIELGDGLGPGFD